MLFGQVVKAVPMQAVKDALVATKNNDWRERGLPKRNVAYFVMALALFPELSYPETFRTLEESKKRLWGHEPAKTPAVSSLVEGRQRLGYASVKAIFDTVVRPVAISGKSKGCFFAGRSVTAIDGVLFNAPDTEENEAYFGKPASQYGKGAYPQVRGVAFVECGTHVLFDFELSDESTRSEQALAEKLLPRAKPGQLLLADRLYCDGREWSIVTKTGADAIFRVKSDVILPVIERHVDGSYESTLCEGDRRKASAKFHKVRVIEYRVGRNTDEPPYRLITTLKCEEADALDVARLYTERWNWETAAKEFKVVLSNSRDVLRSNTPELVKQEIVGAFLAYFAVRSFMHEAALSIDEDVDRLSFKHSVQVIRRNAANVGAFSP